MTPQTFRTLLLYIVSLLFFYLPVEAQQLSDFLPAAKQGNPLAQYNAAICYKYGLGCEPNHSRHLHFMRLAAENGETAAKEQLANTHTTTRPQLSLYWRGLATAENTLRFTTYESYDNGCYYGQRYGGLRDGYGIYLWDSGTHYVGAWENDERYGMGYTVYSDQIHYGHYINHATEFGATLTIDTLHTHIAHCPDGVRHVGNYSGGVPEGIGTIYNSSGEVLYYGPFAAGRPTGTYPSQEHYSSYRWVQEKLPTGDTYEGETVNGLREGFGIYRWAAGSVWFGQWQGGVRSGEGLYIDAEGKMIAGVWVGDEYQE